MNELALPALHGIELFSGVGMLGEGLRAGLDYLGIPYRAVCHVEREAHAASVLVARIEEGSVDAAPIWSDVTTFNARQWRGKVDCVVAGFPCQDLSVAGRRAGLDGDRSGLFFEVVRIADDCGAWLLVLENVAGIVSATASVMDPEEGELDERAASRVLGELADRGWNAEWLTLSASDVGASHGRARWFCVAWRELADTGHDRHGRSAEGVTERDEAFRITAPQDFNVADSSRHVWDGAGDGQSSGRRGICEAGNAVADPDSSGQRAGGRCWNDSERNARALAEQRGDAGVGLFAPGPSDPRWSAIIDRHPELAPALEPTFRRLVNGLAFDMGDSRAARLKCVGNGVVALCAAVASVVLLQRAGIA
ncbi:DNA cytosine methyltransferase [Dechloromonas sp. ARDL1]|uniref:DNA cytosine methyltransferase n=1 Tax=Dechloromonas sp. ARDL1 TaxID=3322121 RepID=UPI003DA776C0